MPSIKVESKEESEEALQQPTDSGAESQETISLPQTPEVPLQKIGRVSKLFLITGLVLFVLLIAGLVWLQQDRSQLKNEVNKLSQSQKTNPADEARQLSAEVGQLIQLPSDEVPTVATVVDADKVKSQAFFASAQNGDKVLVYSKASKAILYRPSTKKIIEVAPINIGNSQTEKQANQ